MPSRRLNWRSARGRPTAPRNHPMRESAAGRPCPGTDGQREPNPIRLGGRFPYRAETPVGRASASVFAPRRTRCPVSCRGKAGCVRAPEDAAVRLPPAREASCRSARDRRACPRCQGTKRRAGETGAPRQSAQNLFAAKQPAKQPARKSFAVAIGVLTVLAVCGIGGYFWWQLQPKTVPIASPLHRSRRLQCPSPAPLSNTPVAGAQPARRPPAAASHGRRPSSDRHQERPTPTATMPTSTAQKPASSLASADSLAPAACADADRLIRVAKTPLKVNPALLRGFDAFNRGDLALAQMEYERAQESDPRNTDVASWSRRHRLAPRPP
jgi:hypothetical protein